MYNHHLLVTSMRIVIFTIKPTYAHGLTYFFLLPSFHGKLVFSVAVDFQTSRLAAFLQAVDRPVFQGFKPNSTARSHMSRVSE